MPNLFVGIGLLFTFAGLVAALTDATGVLGEKGVSAQQATIAVGDLLNVSAAKFYSSMTALFCSLVMNISFKYCNSLLENKMTRISNLLESGVNYVSSESLLQMQLYSLDDQTNQLKTFNNDLASKLGDRIQDAVGKAMDPMVNKMDEITKMGEDYLKGIKEISQNITKDVRGLLEES